MREGKEEDGMADHICNHTFYRSIYIMPTETKKKKIEKNRKKKKHIHRYSLWPKEKLGSDFLVKSWEFEPAQTRKPTGLHQITKGNVLFHRHTYIQTEREKSMHIHTLSLTYTHTKSSGKCISTRARSTLLGSNEGANGRL